MTDLKLTPARAELLKAVSRGEVKHCRRSKPSDNSDEWRLPGGGWKKVSAVVAWLYEKRLIARGPQEHASFFAPRPWQLTEAGERWLAENT